MIKLMNVSFFKSDLPVFHIISYCKKKINKFFLTIQTHLTTAWRKWPLDAGWISHTVTSTAEVFCTQWKVCTQAVHQIQDKHPTSNICCLCQGDSGGPLLYNGIAVGITSNGGKKCGQLKKPGIYTIISHYTDWIDSIMAMEPAPSQEPSS